mgnify:CR=1 FL=1
MKQYHEVACIKDGDTPVSYFLQDTRTLKDPLDLKALLSLPWMKVSREKFEQLVQRNMVRMLVSENGDIVCQLTDDERRMYIHSKIKKDYLDAMEQNYWKNDQTFSSLHVRLAEEGRSLAVCASSVTSVLGMKVVTFTVYGTEHIINYLLSDEKRLKKLGIIVSSRGINNFSFMIIANTPKLVSCLEEALCLLCPILVTTTTFKQSLNDNTIKAGRFVKTGGMQAYAHIAEELDVLTARNLAVLAEPIANGNTLHTSVFS